MTTRIETEDVVEPCRCELYRDIFAEITAKAQPECADPSDPERITSYWIPVGPIHRAAGNLAFQMFNGEAHMKHALDTIERLREENARLREAARISAQAFRTLEEVAVAQLEHDKARNFINLGDICRAALTPSADDDK